MLSSVMQAHSVALLNILAAFQQGESENEFRVNVTYSGKRKYYDIEVTNRTSSEVSMRVAGLWSCDATVVRTGSKVRIKHSHDPVEEEARISNSSIYQGDIDYSEVSEGPFKGTVQSSGKRIAVTDTDVKKKYESEIQ